MDKKNELHSAQDIIKQVLTDHPETRNDDDLLCYKVYESMLPGCGGMLYRAVVLNRKAYKLPAYETVRRTRQKLQREYPELAACKAVRAGRARNEQIFRAFAKEGA